jgi:hypothetical protein
MFAIQKFNLTGHLGNLYIMKKTFIVFTCAALSACATVRKQDLDAWAGMPVEALDTHTLFISMPMKKQITSTGIEVRNYINGKETESCTYNKFTGLDCEKDSITCNNIFYIKGGIILEYVPAGSCKTNETVQPQARYRTLSGVGATGSAK